MAISSDEPTPVSITDEAARWVSESFDDGLSPDQKAQLDKWLAADPRHARAFTEMRSLWAEMDSVPETQALRASVAPAVRDRPYRGRKWRRAARRPRWLAPAIAAGMALIFVGIMEDWPLRFQADAMTASGERRTVALPDGSSIILDTHSAVAVDYSDARRMVRLLKGRAAFSVEADPDRPFMVSAGGGSTTALGTKFLVHTKDEDTQVIVTEHRVRVAYPVSGGHATLLDAGGMIRYGPHIGLGRIASARVDDAMAWTNGMLVFKNTPLGEVVTEIGRYHRGYIRVSPDVRDIRVNGVFPIDDPVAALDQLQRSLGLRSMRVTDHLIFISS